MKRLSTFMILAEASSVVVPVVVYPRVILLTPQRAFVYQRWVEITAHVEVGTGARSQELILEPFSFELCYTGGVEIKCVSLMNGEPLGSIEVSMQTDGSTEVSAWIQRIGLLRSPMSAIGSVERVFGSNGKKKTVDKVGITAVFITGANRGIGLALAQHYAQRGAKVFATARSPLAAEDLNKLALSNGFVTVVPLDVSDSSSVRAMSAYLNGSTIDILINNAGVFGPARQSAVDMDFDGFLSTLSINTLGPLRIAHALLPNLLRAPHPKLVTVSSSLGATTSVASDSIAYRASKAAVHKVMQGLGADFKYLGSNGICTLTIHPGHVRTDLGGKDAPLDPLHCASKIATVIDTLTIETSGRFLSIEGEVIPW